METKNVTPAYTSSIDSVGKPKGGDLTLKEVAEMTNNSRKKNKQMISPCYTIGLDVLQKFIGIPNFQGLNVYNGLTNDGDEVLVIVGATEINGHLHDVLNYAYSINKGAFVQTQYLSAPKVIIRPCPP